MPFSTTATTLAQARILLAQLYGSANAVSVCPALTTQTPAINGIKFRIFCADPPAT